MPEHSAAASDDFVALRALRCCAPIRYSSGPRTLLRYAPRGVNSSS
jgi:hypothetical protein